MHTFERIQTFTNRHPLVGPAFYWVSIQYFITQFIAAMYWTHPFNAKHNTISDLGSTACGIYADRFVCSPLHTWMNASFIVLGITMIAGSTLIYQMFQKNLGSLIGFSFMAIAGFGTVLVGLFPQNTIGEIHGFGAGLAFLVGNLGLAVLGLSLDLPRAFRYYTLISGVVALAALALFVSGNYLGLGIGGMERLAAHPQTFWLIVLGFYMSRNRFRKLATSARHKVSSAAASRNT